MNRLDIVIINKDTHFFIKNMMWILLSSLMEILLDSMEKEK